MCILADNVYMTGKFHFIVKKTPRFRTLLERFTQLSPTTNVDVLNFDS